MPKTLSPTNELPFTGTPIQYETSSRIPVVALGMALASFFAITFVICVLFDLWFPSLAMYPAWAPFLPGFTWISLPSFALGFVEAFAYGWYIAAIFGPLYNFFAQKFS